MNAIYGIMATHRHRKSTNLEALLDLLQLTLKVEANNTVGLLDKLIVRQVRALRDLRCRVLLGQLNMEVDGSLLSTEHGMGNIGRGITVSITDTPNTTDVGTHATSVDDDLVACDVQAHLGG